MVKEAPFKENKPPKI